MQVRDWSVYKRYQQGDLLAFLSDDGHEIEILELLMQVYQPPAQEQCRALILSQTQALP